MQLGRAPRKVADTTWDFCRDGPSWGSACSCLPRVFSLPRGAGQKELDQEPAAFRVFPSSGLLEARSVNAPPTSIVLQVLFTARYSPSQPPALPKAGAPSSPQRPRPTGAVSCMSPRWWWKVCSARTPAPCGSGAEALTMRDLCHPTSSEALPSEPPHPPANFGNKHGPEPRTGVLCRAHAQGPLSSPWTERAGLSSGPACPSSEAAAPCRLWWLRISTQTEPRRDKHGKKLTYIYYVYCILIQSPFPIIT